MPRENLAEHYIEPDEDEAAIRGRVMEQARDKELSTEQAQAELERTGGFAERDIKTAIVRLRDIGEDVRRFGGQGIDEDELEREAEPLKQQVEEKKRGFFSKLAKLGKRLFSRDNSPAETAAKIAAKQKEFDDRLTRMESQAEDKREAVRKEQEEAEARKQAEVARIKQAQETAAAKKAADDEWRAGFEKTGDWHRPKKERVVLSAQEKFDARLGRQDAEQAVRLRAEAAKRERAQEKASVSPFEAAQFKDEHDQALARVKAGEKAFEQNMLPEERASLRGATGRVIDRLRGRGETGADEDREGAIHKAEWVEADAIAEAEETEVKKQLLRHAREDKQAMSDVRRASKQAAREEAAHLRQHPELQRAAAQKEFDDRLARQEAEAKARREADRKKQKDSQNEKFLKLVKDIDEGLGRENESAARDEQKQHEKAYNLKKMHGAYADAGLIAKETPPEKPKAGALRKEYAELKKRRDEEEAKKIGKGNSRYDQVAREMALDQRLAEKQTPEPPKIKKKGFFGGLLDGLFKLR